MPRFTKSCHNPLHHEWTHDTADVKIVCLRANDLGEVAKIYKSLETEEGARRQNLTNSCTQCLMNCCRREVFNEELMGSITPTLIDKVGMFICWFIFIENTFRTHVLNLKSFSATHELPILSSIVS